jgi:gamma-glutamyltranspeptidase
MGDPDFPIPNEVTNATTQDAVDALTRGPYMEQLRQASSDDSMLNLSQYGGAKFAQLHDNDGQGEAKDAKEGDRRGRKRRLLGVDSPTNVRQRRLVDPFGYLNDDGTSHFSVIDKDGNSVAMTTSVNSRFGSCVVSEATGILLNNQMDGKWTSI